jgi:hypothetical protein
MAVDILLSALNFSNREWTRTDAKNKKSKSNRRLTQIDADKSLENRLCDRTTLHLRASVFIRGSYLFVSIRGSFGSSLFAFIRVHSRFVFEFDCASLFQVVAFALR